MRLRLLVPALVLLSCSLFAHADTVTDQISESIAGPNNLLFVLNYTLTFDPSVDSTGDEFGYTSIGLTYDGGTFLGPALNYEEAFDNPIQYKFGAQSDSLEIETNGFYNGYGYLIYISDSQSNPSAGEFQITNPQGSLVDQPLPTSPYVTGVTVTRLNENPENPPPVPEPSSLLLLGTGLLGLVGARAKRFV